MKHLYFVSNNLVSKTNVIHSKETTFKSAREKTMLSKKGEENALSLTKMKVLEDIEVVYASEYFGAMNTGKYIAEEKRIDLAARYFGQLLGELFVYEEDVWEKTLRRMGFYLGKFIYLLDAWEDIEEDCQTGNYNPFFGIYREKKKEEFNVFVIQLLEKMAAECCKAFEALPIIDNVEILRNILYYSAIPSFLDTSVASAFSASALSPFRKSRNICKALLVAMARLISLPWSSSTLYVTTLSREPHASHIVPTGIPGEPPDGPAIPVAAMA